MSISFTLTTSIFVLPSFQVGAANRNYYRAIDVDAIYNFEGGGLNSILIERSSTASVVSPSLGTSHTAFDFRVIAFNPGNTITTDLSSVIPHCLVKA